MGESWAPKPLYASIAGEHTSVLTISHIKKNKSYSFSSIRVKNKSKSKNSLLINLKSDHRLSKDYNKKKKLYSYDSKKYKVKKYQTIGSLIVEEYSL